MGSVAVQSGRVITNGGCVNRLVALADSTSSDIVLGVVKALNVDRKQATVLTPRTEATNVRCLVIGDVSIDLGTP